MKIIISTIIIVFFSCNSTRNSAKSQDFPSGKYQILKLKAEKFKADKTYTININTEDQRIGGKFDCNNFSCEYEKDGQKIDFGYATATEMYCEGEMHNERAFIGSLNKLESFNYDGEIISFYDENEKMILKLKKQE